MSAPEISVLLPTYEYAAYLPEAIESVLAQEFQNFELLILDDCSKDNSTEVIQSYARRDARIRFSVNQTNLGMVANWNECLRRAQGAYIKFLFGDDKLADPRALGKLLALLKENPTASLAASARVIMDGQSRVIEQSCPLRGGVHSGGKVIIDALRDGSNPIGEPSTVLFRKADAARGFDPSYRQFVDLEMWFHLLRQGDLACTTEPLCAFRRHARQQTAVNNATFSIKENLMLVSTYGLSPAVPRAAQLDILYRTRRGLRRDPGARAQFAALERQFGSPTYAMAGFKYALLRPFERLARRK